MKQDYKNKNKFKIVFQEPFSHIDSEQIISAKLPTLIYSDDSGQFVWTNFNIKIIDTLGESTSFEIIKNLKLYENKKDFIVDVYFLNSWGKELEGWTYECKIQSIDFGDLNIDFIKHTQSFLTISIDLKVSAVSIKNPKSFLKS